MGFNWGFKALISLTDIRIMYIYFHGTTAPIEPGPPHYWAFTITFTHTALNRTPLEEWSARRRDLYLTTYTIYTKRTSMPLARFEHTVPVSEQPADRRLRPRGHRHLLSPSLCNYFHNRDKMKVIRACKSERRN